MKRSFFIQPSLDTTGFWASAICAVHCIAVPVLLSFSTFGFLAFLENDYIEYTIICISLIVGVTSLLPSYFRHHRKFNALYFLLAGFSLIFFGRFTTNSLYEIIFTSVGAVCIAFAHLVNFRMCRKYHNNA